MTKAVAPMIGGIIVPPVEAQASMAPAVLARTPMRFIAGIVKAPVVRTLVIGPPLMEPNRPDEKIATLAGPPRTWPNSANARLMKNWPPPV